MIELLQSIKSDLLSRRVLPVLIALGVGLVIALGYAFTSGSSSSAPTVSASIPAAGAGGPAGRAGSVLVSVAPANPQQATSETPGGARYQSKDPTRDPFIALPAPKTAKSAGSSKSSTSSSAGKSSPGGTPSAGKGSTGNSAPAPVPTTKLPAKVAPKPTHTGLTSTQSYEIALSLTSQGGNLDAIESLERLSVLPSEQQPLLVYLGVLQGGHDALFAVPHGTVVSGPGGCTPGPTDCEVLSLASNQIESLATSTGVNVALFTITAIRIQGHPTVAAANHARTEVSTFGDTLLKSVTLPALALFEYEPAQGAVVDLRNLAVGGEK
jgi:hypothetical protein